jgi:hypothetical protein
MGSPATVFETSVAKVMAGSFFGRSGFSYALTTNMAASKSFDFAFLILKKIA